jgi:hypothetical protein
VSTAEQELNTLRQEAIDIDKKIADAITAVETATDSLSGGDDRELSRPARLDQGRTPKQAATGKNRPVLRA